MSFQWPPAVCTCLAIWRGWGARNVVLHDVFCSSARSKVVYQCTISVWSVSEYRPVASDNLSPGQSPIPIRMLSLILCIRMQGYAGWESQRCIVRFMMTCCLQPGSSFTFVCVSPLHSLKSPLTPIAVCIFHSQTLYSMKCVLSYRWFMQRYPGKRKSTLCCTIGSIKRRKITLLS